jgi:hypothetical protein
LEVRFLSALFEERRELVGVVFGALEVKLSEVPPLEDEVDEEHNCLDGAHRIAERAAERVEARCGDVGVTVAWVRSVCGNDPDARTRCAGFVQEGCEGSVPEGLGVLLGSDVLSLKPPSQR